MSWLALALFVAAIALGGWQIQRASRRSPSWWWWWTAPALLLAGAGTCAACNFFARKLVAALVMPAGLLWLTLILALTIALCRRRSWPALAIGSFLLAYSAAGSNPLGMRLAAGLESGVPDGDIFDQPPFDALVVLGGGNARRPDYTPQLGTSGDRIMVAAELYLAGKAQLLVATGDLGSDEVLLWKRLGVPQASTLVLAEPQDTAQEVAAVGELLRTRAWKRVGLVSSAWHLPRALHLCARQGIVVVPVPCDFHGIPVDWTAAELVPQWIGFFNVEQVAWEYVGRWSGR